MVIYPAIDLLDGCVVRLQQGKRELCTVYSADPVAFAIAWKNAGAKWLHVVDLDGAFSGSPKNLHHVSQMVRVIGVPIQLGGGIRDVETIGRVLDAGVTRVVLGTRACESIDFVREAIERFGSDKIAVGIDARDGKVAVEGWTKASSWDAYALAQAVSEAGVRTMIYTDVSTDGMFTGPNIGVLETLVANEDWEIIASGGIGSLDDIRSLKRLRNLCGVIIGKALYDKRVDLREAIMCAGDSFSS
jgi:phosphoribosylformimino-5-aminoimidazole carboxamide ribotide isomerase